MDFDPGYQTSVFGIMILQIFYVSKLRIFRNVDIFYTDYNIIDII